MSVQYQAVGWNRQKRLYDLTLGTGILLFLATFVGLSLRRPDATLETALIRALGVLGLTLLHIILVIGPLARLDRRFLPLLYNRRHLGVTMALIGLSHAVFATLQYHGGADLNPIVSLLSTGQASHFPAEFPFEYFGLGALAIIVIMATTSHDFWLSVFGARAWKALHMGVYFAYGFLVLHVALGVLQAEGGSIGAGLLGAGVVVVLGLHVVAGIREWQRDKPATEGEDGWIDVGPANEIPSGRAKPVVIAGERAAVFRYDDKVSCVSGVCRHQGGPLAEGRIVDGCITCPWHGYQYFPDSGTSPPPFTDRLPTFNVRIRNGRVEVHHVPNAPGTRVEPARIT
jgi:nitrite reductase/ring-hydroxylating ferredoxin subunit/DMSO/TMAO reductase YedYZ heme-binding membrane subunit